MKKNDNEKNIHSLFWIWDKEFNSIGFDAQEYEDSETELSDNAFHCSDKAWEELKDIASKQSGLIMRATPARTQ